MISSPSTRAQTRGGTLELLEDARLVALAALLELERQVVQAMRGRFVVVGIERQRLAGGPRVGGGGVRVLADRHGLLERDPGRLEDVGLAGRLGGEPGGLARGLGERGVDVGGVVELDEFRRALDDLGLADPLAGDLVLVAAAAAEREVRRDRRGSRAPRR